MTLTIEIPDTEIAVLPAISKLIKKAGGSMSIDEDDNLTESEFALLQESYKEALLIKKGIKKGIPASELWND